MASWLASRSLTVSPGEASEAYNRIAIDDHVADGVDSSALAGAKLISGIYRTDVVRVRAEEGSVYGAALVMPQVARSLGWSTEFVLHSITSFFFLFICVFVHMMFLMYIDKEERVLDSFSGQMYICDFGAGLELGCEGKGCWGPSGTPITGPRLYGWASYALRGFAVSALNGVFPELKESISANVDQGEYGLESYWCRLICCIILVVSTLPELFLCWDMFKLLWYVPNVNEPWVILSEKDEDKESEVKVKVAGMSLRWKIWNFIFVLGPKSFLVYYTLKAGMFFLIESGAIDSLIVNSVALEFLLALDNLITDSLMSAETRKLLDMCEELEISHSEAADHMTSQQVFDKYMKPVGSFRFALGVIHKFIFKEMPAVILTGVLTTICFSIYYHSHCILKNGTYVSMPMYGKEDLEFSVQNSFFPMIFPIRQDSAPFWQMPE